VAGGCIVCREDTVGKSAEGFCGGTMGETPAFFEDGPESRKGQIGDPLPAVHHHRSQKTGRLPKQKKPRAPVGEGAFNHQVPNRRDRRFAVPASLRFGVPLKAKQVGQGGGKTLRIFFDPDQMCRRFRGSGGGF
jgi:hypothetical protein